VKLACPACGGEYRKRALGKHFRREHADLICPWCPEWFVKPLELQMHAAKAHGMDSSDIAATRRVVVTDADLEAIALGFLSRESDERLREIVAFGDKGSTLAPEVLARLAQQALDLRQR
jgi:hypothetical protein